MARTGAWLGWGVLVSSLGSSACATDSRDPPVVGAGGQLTRDGLPVSSAGAGGGAGLLPDGVDGAGAEGAGVDGVGVLPGGFDAGGACEEGATRACGNDEGVCEFGAQTCAGGTWGECAGGVLPAPRDCTSLLDNDCDGQVDNLLDATCACVPGEVDERCGERPESFGKGACVPGVRQCVPSEDGTSSSWSECVGAVGPLGSDDRCDVPNDDNCDGTPNGGCPCAPGVEQACGPESDAGVCTPGVAACENGVLGACSAVFPGPRDCSANADNDCNGTVDIDEIEFCQCVIGQSEPCNAHPGLDGQGRCRAGSRSCVGRLDGTRSEFGECVGGVGPLGSDSCAAAGDDSNCDGEENGGCACVIGVPGSCENPDPANCAVECVRDGSDFSTRCAVAALDRDGDGASSCAAAPTPGGPDCDDRASGVRPGAVEVCNGVDDDCDGRIDLADGLGVGGITTPLPGLPGADVAHSPDDAGFRFVAERGENGGVAFGIVNRDFAFPLSGSVDPGSAQIPNAVPRVAEQGGQFAVTYTRPSRGGPAAFLAMLSRVDADGTVLASTPLGDVGGSDVSVIAGPSGQWITAMQRVGFDPDPFEVLELGRVDASDAYAAASDRPLEDMGAPHLASIDGGVALIWQAGYSFNSGGPLPSAIRWASFDRNLALAQPIEQVEVTGTHPDIVAVSAGYFMAWAVGAGIRYQLIGTNGTALCSSASPFGNGVLDGADAIALEDTPIGVVGLATDSDGGNVGVFIFDPATCRELQQGLIPASSTSPSPRLPELPNLAHGSGDIVFAWTEGGIDSQLRRTSQLICN